MKHASAEHASALGTGGREKGSGISALERAGGRASIGTKRGRERRRERLHSVQAGGRASLAL